MVNGKRSLFLGGLGALALCAAFGARAQESNSVIGPPQLKDFQLEGRRQVAAPPAPQAQPPAQTPPATAAPRSQTQVPARPQPERTAPGPRRESAPTAAATAAPQQAAPAESIDQVAAEAPAAVPSPAVPVTPESVPAAEAAPTGWNLAYWYYAAPAAALALLGFVMLRRRRRVFAEAMAEEAPLAAAPAPAPPPAPRPDPSPRPWLELALKAERASFTDSEAELLFELEISNKGGSTARNLRIDVKMFNGGIDQQDKDIGAFFRTAGRETTKLNLPAVDAGVTGVIQGRVTMAREDMRALRLDERLLFIPVVAVNALYDWGEGRTGQTSKSYIIGRELQQTSDKMGAFRVDQGPRVWRTVAQRDHTLAKRV